MNTSSRFSVLSPEVDLNSAHRIKVKPKVKQEQLKKDTRNIQVRKTQEKTVTKGNKQIGLNNSKKKKNDSDISKLQALAFGFGKPNKKGSNSEVKEKDKEKSTSKNNKKRKGVPQTPDEANINQDEDWYKRDEKFIKEENEKCLREAILQSKLEFEEKKKFQEEIQRDEKENAKPILTKSKAKKKKDKPLTLSLDQFNTLQPKELATLRDPNVKSGPEKPKESVVVKTKEEKFFREVDEAAQRTLDKERRQEQYEKYRAKANKVNSEAQAQAFIAEIEKRDFEIQALRLEVDSLQGQMQAVKSRNKKLCEVISFSEMRSKGELVVELEKVTKGRDEFSEEIVRLTAELEQERTKVSQLTTELKKMQGKKRNPDSSSK